MGLHSTSGDSSTNLHAATWTAPNTMAARDFCGKRIAHGNIRNKENKGSVLNRWLAQGENDG